MPGCRDVAWYEGQQYEWVIKCNVMLIECDACRSLKRRHCRGRTSWTESMACLMYGLMSSAAGFTSRASSLARPTSNTYCRLKRHVFRGTVLTQCSCEWRCNMAVTVIVVIVIHSAEPESWCSGSRDICISSLLHHIPCKPSKQLKSHLFVASFP